MSIAYRVSRDCRARRGMCVLEVLISLAIVAMLLTAVAAAFDSSAQIIEANDQFFRATQAGRVSLNQIVTEVRRSHAASVADSHRIDMITYDDEDRSYIYDPTTQTIKLVQNATGNTFTLASNVASCDFAQETWTDPKTLIVHVVRVSVSLDVRVQKNEVKLSGSAAPRREVKFN